MNSYVTLDKIKSSGVMRISSSDEDRELLDVAIAQSRVVDRITGRHFYVLSQTREFDGDGSLELLTPDLIAITTLKTDEDQDRTFEVTWTTSDYLLEPANADPANASNPNSYPYSKIVVDPYGNRGEFITGRRIAEVVGSWGWWQHLKRATAVVNEAVDTTETEIDVDVQTDLEVGQTILVNSEQMFISGIQNQKITVRRAVNGTTAASHSSTDPIDVYEYPDDIVRATIMLTIRYWRNKDNFFGSSQGFPDGSFVNFARLPADLQAMLGQYRNMGAGIVA